MDKILSYEMSTYSHLQIESRLSTISNSPYDVVAIRFHHLSDVAATTTASLPPSITVIADLIVSTSQNVSMVTVQDALQEASTLPDGSDLFYILVEPSTGMMGLLHNAGGECYLSIWRFHLSSWYF